MRLLKLDERVQDMIVEEMLTTGHARALLSIGKSDLQYQLANQIYEENLSVRETEKLVKKVLSDLDNENAEEVEVPEEDTTQLDEIYKSMEENIKDLMGTKVSIKRKANNRGKIEIEYFSFDELERLYDMIKHIKKI
jgi:ParB family chromosome partitioning protein